ncbi:uncharacterized protein F4812DRAFT_465841 [Daldinia caldariorum]|uniref:uncharacterized protein n=1 Tax=Daldinia caldariorum TaxID=326644 RepID=UPI00200752CA|nr:uncharacterized protein F4812DRAFT_465841 [Daldinia caldariorum]KAI1465908.1 hypothetical protein F4812DRAFT_465841 [Daldinia caldariorum]
MRAAQALKAKSKAKERAGALNLSIQTDFRIEDAASSISGGMDFTQVASAPPRKVQFDITSERPPAPKASEAMMNSDWRNNRRNGNGVPLAAPVTAGLEKTEFQMTGRKNLKKLTIDTSLSNGTGVRRYRDTPIDPDFIHSAPITKKDYETVNDETEPDSSDNAQYSSTDTTLPLDSPDTKMSIVRLESPMPFMSEGFRQFTEMRDYFLEEDRKFESGDEAYDDKCGPKDMTLRAVPIVSPYQKNKDEPIFPVATVKAIKHSKRFTNVGWASIDKDLENGWAKIQGPRTAGLPIKQLREDYESKFPSQAEVEKDQARFDALISKLQKASAGRLNGQSGIDVRSSNSSQELESAHRSESGSHDSGISGVDVKTSQRRGTTLNPKASEFQISSGISTICLPDMRNYSLDYNHQPPLKKNGYRITSSMENGSSKTRSVTAEDIERIYACMNDLKAQMTRIEAGTRQRSSMIEASPMVQFNQIQNLASQLGLNPVSQGSCQELQNFLGPRPGPGTWTGVQQMPNIQQCNNDNAAFMPPSRLQGTQAPRLQMAPSPMSYGPGPGAPVVGGQGLTGPGNPGHIPLHAQAQMVYGPRPVRKPKGPQHPGDPSFTQQQQSYEEYLENKRATDRAYALQCRDRQARRFHRQRVQGSTVSQLAVSSSGVTAPHMMPIARATTNGASQVL